MNRIFLAGAVAAVVLSGCTPKIDTGSPQAFSQSIAKMTEDMSQIQKDEFRNALLAIAFNGSDDNNLMKSVDIGSPLFLGAAERIKGMTAPEILKLGYQTRLASLDARMKEAVGEVQRVEEQRTKYKAVFDNIHLDNARYYVGDSGFMQQPVIAFRITNSSKIAIARIYVRGVLISAGRSIPWVSDDFNYEFSGGLEPGESEQLDLEPNMFGEWKLDDRYSRRDDLKLTLTLVNVEDASGNKLLDGEPGDVEVKKTELADMEKTRAGIQKKLEAL